MRSQVAVSDGWPPAAPVRAGRAVSSKRRGQNVSARKRGQRGCFLQAFLLLGHWNMQQFFLANALEVVDAQQSLVDRRGADAWKGRLLSQYKAFLCKQTGRRALLGFAGVVCALRRCGPDQQEFQQVPSH